MTIKDHIVKLLHDTADKIDAGTCEMTEEQAVNVIELISHQPMSKDSACSYLKISRSKFDELVRKGDLPKGRKRRGFKELVWWKDEIDSMRKMWL